MFQKHCLSLADAKKIAAAAEEEAVKNGWKVVIAIVDDGAHLLYLQRLDGTQVASSLIAVGKAETAAKFKRPSKVMEDAVANGRTAMLSMPGLTALEGAVPLIYKGDVVGAIGVSGVQSSQDAQVAMAGAKVLEGL
jgi:glc operon protein GlcG